MNLGKMFSSARAPSSVLPALHDGPRSNQTSLHGKASQASYDYDGNHTNNFLKAKAVPGLQRYVNSFIFFLLVLPLPLIYTTDMSLFNKEVSIPGTNTTLTTSFLVETVHGSFLHIILEWSAVCIAFLTLVVSTVHFVVRREAVVPLFGVAFMGAGTMDAVHALASVKLFGDPNQTADFVPFTWAMSRMFNACILLSAVFVASHIPEGSRVSIRQGLVSIALASVAMSSLVAVTVAILATVSLPRTTYPDNVVTRPFDVAVVPVYLIVAVLLRRFNKRPWCAGIAVGNVLDIGTQLYMSFGSTALFDDSFNVAHALKACGYLCPFISFVMDLGQAFREGQERERLIQRLNKEALKQRQAAQDASDAKTRFMASVSHELRTPLHGILGNLELLSDCPIEEERTRYINSIHTTGKALLQIVNNILLFSEASYGSSVRLNIMPMSVRSLIESVVDLLRAHGHKFGVDVFADVADDIPPECAGDYARLRQVLLNLAGNAIKFTSSESETATPGLVTIRAKRVDAERCPYLISFEVQDNGIGMTKETKDSVFQPFWQLDQGAARRFGGTGLGLSIVAELGQAMNATIHVESEPGVGSVFSYVVDLDPQLQTTPCSPHRSSSPLSFTRDTDDETAEEVDISELHAKLLVVDDSEVNRRLVANMLRKTPVQVTVAANGKECIDLLATQQGGFDIILMDCHMPIMDGYEATKHIRMVQKQNLPIIAVTASAFRQDMNKCLDVGMDDFISKPFNRAKLSRILHKWTVVGSARRV